MIPVGEHPFGSGQTVRQGCGSGVVADLACGHEELQRTTLGVRDGVQPGVQPILGPPDQAPALVVGLPLFRPQARSRAVGLRVSRVDHDGLLLGAFRRQPRHHPGEDPMSPHRFHRLQSVFGGPYSRGASHHLKPLRLTKIIPLRTRRSSTRGLPWLFGKNGLSRSICSSVSHNRVLISTPISSGARTTQRQHPQANQCGMNLGSEPISSMRFRRIRELGRTRAFFDYGSRPIRSRRACAGLASCGIFPDRSCWRQDRRPAPGSRQEEPACDHRPKAQTAIRQRLRQEIAEAGAQRAGRTQAIQKPVTGPMMSCRHRRR